MNVFKSSHFEERKSYRFEGTWGWINRVNIIQIFFINSAFKVLLALVLLLILSILTLSHASLPSRTPSHVWVQLLSVLFFNLSVFTFLLTRCARVPLLWIQNLPRLIPLYHHPGLPLFLSFIQPITPALSTLLLLPSISAPSRFPHLQSPSSVISQQEKIYFVLQPVFVFLLFHFVLIHMLSSFCQLLYLSWMLLFVSPLSPSSFLC